MDDSSFAVSRFEEWTHVDLNNVCFVWEWKGIKIAGNRNDIDDGVNFIRSDFYDAMKEFVLRMASYVVVFEEDRTDNSKLLCR